MTGQQLLYSYNNSLLDYIKEEDICNALRQLVRKILTTNQTYKKDIMPILSYLYNKIDTIYSNEEDKEIYELLINLAERYISSNNVPINMIALDKDKLNKVLEYTLEILKIK